MSEFKPITTLADLDCQDDHEMVLGYLSGLRGEKEPGSDKSRSFWHGWRNGMTDSARQQPDAAQASLAKAIVERGDMEAIFGAKQ